MRKLIIALVVVALLLVVADRLSAGFVEDRLAARIDTKEGVDGSTVDISGFPFLTQVLQNHFDQATVSLPTVSADTAVGSVQVEDLKIDLRDIETSHTYTRATAKSVTGSGLVPYSEFDKFPGITVDYGGEAPDGRGYVDISLAILGGRSVRVQPDVVKGLSLGLALEGVSAVLPPRLETFLRQQFKFAGLPQGITIADVTATEAGLEVTLTGSNVDIAR